MDIIIIPPIAECGAADLPDTDHSDPGMKCWHYTEYLLTYGGLMEKLCTLEDSITLPLHPIIANICYEDKIRYIATPNQLTTGVFFEDLKS